MAPIDPIKLLINKGVDPAQHGTGALKADAGKNKKFEDELIAQAYGGATGYVSPPALDKGGSAFGFGPGNTEATT